MELEQILQEITPVNQELKKQVEKRFYNLAIPLGSLGELQRVTIDICGASNQLRPNISKRALFVFCADNGVVDEGISQVGSSVTTAVARSLTKHATVMCRMADFAKIEVVPVDIGMKEPVENPMEKEKILDKNIARGTRNFAKEPAMTRTQAERAIKVGIELAIAYYNQGYTMLAVGEMGIGNTTTSSAMASVLLGRPVVEMTGPGAGLSAEGVQHKVAVIEQALAHYQLDKDDVLSVLSTVGGYDIAGMMGIMIGCAYCKIPCILDGFISSVAGLAAKRLCQPVGGYLIPSHCSAEPAGLALLQALELRPLITAGMRLGEGSGAVAAIPLFDMAMKVYQEAVTFEDMQIDAYQPL